MARGIAEANWRYAASSRTRIASCSSGSASRTETAAPSSAEASWAALAFRFALNEVIAQLPGGDDRSAQAARGSSSGPARLPDVGRAGREAVVEAKPDRRVDLVPVEVAGLDPCDLGGLHGALELAADRSGPQADVDRLADLLDLVALQVGDQVIRRGEHAHDAGDLDLEPGLLLALAHGGLGHGFALLHAARGDGPQPRVGPLQQHHPACLVAHQHGCGRLAAGRLRRLRG